MIGIGIPTTGNKPVTIPIFIAMYTKKLNDIPKQTKRPKVDLESFEILSILSIKNMNKSSKIILPKKPNCSANAVKIKSV